jgi:hypothetical protein
VEVVRDEEPTDKERRPENHGGLGDVLLLHMRHGDVDKLSQWAAQKDHKLAVLLDGQILRGIPVHSLSAAQEDILRVELARTAENRATWGSLLGGRIFHKRTVVVQIGLDDGTPLSTATLASALHLTPFSHKRTGYALVAVALAIVLAFVAAGRRTTMLRDGRTPEGELGAFSLSRVQAALWTAQIVIAFLWIWAITGEADTVTDSCMALVGLCSGTAVGGALVDKNKAATVPVGKSGGLLADLLTEQSGYALHRFQMVLWTGVVSVLFWSSVYHHLAMPELDTTLLGLMGISSVTYLGLKAPKQGAAADEKEGGAGKTDDPSS